MRPSHDLMERLAAADPLPEAERLTAEERREADSLLANLLATPVPDDRRAAPRRRTRRWALAATATACVALAALAAANLLDSDGPGPNVIELAVAAVSHDDAVYHALERRSANTSGPGSLPRDDGSIYVESWYASDGRRHEKWFKTRGGHRGKFVTEFAGRRTPGRRGGPMLIWDGVTNTIVSRRFGYSPGASGVPSVDPSGDLGEGLRALEANGRLRVAGTTEVDGGRAYRLTSGTVEGPTGDSKERLDFVVDAETYLPLALRYTNIGETGNKSVLTSRYLVYERLPLNKRTGRLLDLDPHPGAKCGPEADEIMGRGSLGFPNPCAR
jgi:hypothetical protein